MKKNYLQNRPFVKPSFVEGISRILDLGITLQKYNTSENESDADSRALKSDWEVIGNDLKSSIKTYEQQAHPKTAL
jgi:hypothetical protein